MARGGDWLGTVRQAVPDLLRILPRLRPTLELESVAALDEAVLRDLGVTAVIWDVDGTLMENHGRRVSADVAPQVHALFEAPGLRHAILSNSGERRFQELGRIFPGVPVLRAYATPGGTAFRRLLRGTDAWRGPGEERGPPRAARSCEHAGVEPLRVIKKPSALLVDYALAELGVNRREAVLVGDQYFTDVAGANLAGVRSIKVRTIGRGRFPLPVRVLQRLEDLLVRIFYGRRAAGPPERRPRHPSSPIHP